MGRKDAIIAQMAANERLNELGKLSDNALHILNSQLQAQLQEDCRHPKTEKEYRGHGWIEWCADDDCGVLVSTHGDVRSSSDEKLDLKVGTTKRRRSGCLTGVVMLTAAAAPLALAASEVVNAIG